MPLSAIAVTHAKPREKPYKLTDERGLYLLVTGEGHRYWRFNYRFGGKHKTLALGVYPDVGLADAREKRDAARRLLAAGEDPMERRREDERETRAREQETLRHIGDEWLERDQDADIIEQNLGALRVERLACRPESSEIFIE
jgi:hypothetical protein